MRGRGRGAALRAAEKSWRTDRESTNSEGGEEILAREPRVGDPRRANRRSTRTRAKESQPAADWAETTAYMRKNRA